MMDEITEKDNTNTAKNNDMLRIHLNIAERRIPFQIKREKEERIRKAATLINDKVVAYKKRYPGRDTQDALSVATLQFVVRMLDLSENNDMQAMDMKNEIKKLGEDIDEYLQFHEQK